MEIGQVKKFLTRIITATSFSFLFSHVALAYPFTLVPVNNFFYSMGQRLACFTLDCPHWYVSGNVGVSHLHDEKAPRSNNSVDQNGPGWNVNMGYQVNSIIGAELGYIQYHDSRETRGSNLGGSITIAKTEHYAAYLAATARVPLIDKFSALGKLGIAYSYANKVFTTGPSASSGAGSLFTDLGIAYSVTPKVDFNFQWSVVRGNRYTGSSELYSLGATFAIV